MIFLFVDYILLMFLIVLVVKNIFFWMFVIGKYKGMIIFVGYIRYKLIDVIIFLYFLVMDIQRKVFFIVGIVRDIDKIWLINEKIIFFYVIFNVGGGYDV